jgi:hypothetical protein
MASDKDPISTSGGTGDRNVRNNFNKIVWVILLIALLAIIGAWIFVRSHGPKIGPLQKSQTAPMHLSASA